MADFLAVVLFSMVMGFSIYLALPIILKKHSNSKTITMLNAGAIGILIFLIMDIFSNVAPILYKTNSLYGYGADPVLSAIFAIALAVGFFMLYRFEGKSPHGLTPSKTSLMIATGIGLQNLTEGLVFGSLSVSVGLFSGVALVVLLGFIMQNLTEGFPIAAPFINSSDKKLGVLALLFLIGGLPTVIGGIVGFFYNSIMLNLIFDGLAIGAILYVILPMIKHQFKNIETHRQNLIYLGIFIGFIVGFLVNLI